MLRLAIVSFLLLFASIGFAQQPSAPVPSNLETFDALRNSTAKVRERAEQVSFNKTKKRQIDRLLNMISANTKKLNDTASLGTGATIPQEYLESLKLDAELLTTLAAGISNSSSTEDKVVDKLNQVNEDLEAKVVFSQMLMGAGLRLVEFIVTTKKDGKEIGGYEVYYVPLGWWDTPDKFRRADQPSSPAIMKLAPGNYLVWLKKGEMLTEKVPYTLGKEGSRKEVVFPIP
jgi:hypothetical protein